ncbi:AAA family ATPase [Dysgonomonas mossii]|uniref:AAA family ATPase n=1 Tax=Dysgonomonas mossii TaxID=163665 RepID=UPI0039948879
MKILAIRGKNLASLEGQFNIDFTVEPLKSSGIFAITGQTGAGKSTILDALCLALFDNAPRLNKAESSVNVYDVEEKTITQKDSRNILRRGASEGYAEVDFVALNGDKYRSRWMVRRARGKADGTLQATSIKLDNLTGNSEEQGTKSNLLNRIVELIGLSFDQFTRAVLLAQGDFANFLKAKSSEKAELLEKLTGTEIYSKISVSIYQKTTDAKNALDLILQRMKDVKLLTDEELNTLIEENNTKNEELKPLKIQAGQIEKKLSWIKEDDLIKQELNQAEKELEAIQLTIRGASPRYEYMDMIDKSLEIRDSYIGFINKTNGQENILTEIEKDETILKNISEQLEKTTISLSEAKKTQEEIDAKYNSLKPDINLAKELDIKIQASIEKQAELKKELETYKKQLLASDETIASQKESQEKTIKEKAQLEQWFLDNDVYKTIVSKVDLIENLINTAYSAQRQKENTSNSLKTNKAMLETTQKQLRRFELEAERLNNLLPTEIINLRHKLIEGEACPVCGSNHHPFKDNIEQSQKINEEELEANKQRVQNNINKLKTQIEQTQKGITEFETYIKNFEEQYGNSYSSLKDNLNLLPDWETKLKAETLGKELSLFATQWHDNRKRLDSSTLFLENVSARIITEEKARSPILENISNKEKGYQSEEELHKKNIEQRKLLLGGKSVEEVEKHYLNSRELQSKLLENLNIEKEKIDAQKSSLTGKIEQQKKDAETNEKEINRLKIQIQEWLKDENHQISAEILKDLISKSREWINQEKQYLSEIQNKRLTAEATLTERKKRNIKHLESEDKPLDEETKDSLSENLNTISELTESINKQLSEIEVSLLSHEKGKEQIKSFEKELNEKSELFENWSKLNDLLGSANGNKFKTIAQGYTLDVLLSYANKHLKDLTQRYSLEKIPDTLALLVVDNDMLGEVRSVHSLSGGESFLISLALALGLSSLSSNRMKIESLFIDEGFGALDIDTLSVAMDALDNLQTQGRKIGVISHVEEMKERITTQIQVIKSANGRSSVNIIG